MPTWFQWTETNRQLLLAGLLLLLLPLLAVLQYRWLGQLSESERKQMQAGLRAAAARFGEDFDQEITSAYAAFLPDFPSAESGAAGRLARGYARWQTASRHSRLIGAMYQARADEAGGLTLLRFDPAAGRTEPDDWPAEMATLRAKLREQINRLREHTRRPAGNDPPSGSFSSPPMLEANPPTLLIPQPELAAMSAGPEFMGAAPISFFLVRLNEDYVTREFLPALARRHFGEGPQASYVLAVRDLATQQTWFESAASAPAPTPANADASVGFFRLRTADLRDRMRQRLQMAPMPPPELLLRPGAERRGPPARTAAFPMPLMGMLAAADQKADLWELRVRHQSGSVAAAVARARRGNLLLSSSILALLAGSVVLLIRSARRAHQLARQQMDFVAGISHELRTPITVIDSAAYNLARGVTRGPEQMRQYGELIRKQTRQLHEMIEQVLEFAGIQAGPPSLAMQPVPLTPLLREFIEANRPLLAERGFYFEADMADALPVVRADAAALRRVLQNLLDNAQKYSGESRWIGLQAAVEDGVQPAQVVLSVRDRGMGIPEADLPHIFEPFYRGGEARAAQIHGNGLGLSLVLNIVRAHRGSLAVRSRPGEGSLFTIRLPLDETSVRAGAAEPHGALSEATG